LVINPDTELALPVAGQRFQAVAAKRSQVLKRRRGVEPDQARSSLFLNVQEFANAMAGH
jgi:hypothetical protein